MIIAWIKSECVIDPRGWFTDEVAEKYGKMDGVLFISDIRTANPRNMSEEEVEQRVMEVRCIHVNHCCKRFSSLKTRRTTRCKSGGFPLCSRKGACSSSR